MRSCDERLAAAIPQVRNWRHATMPRCLDTTTIYAKINVPALCEVALPWPEVIP